MPVLEMKNIQKLLKILPKKAAKSSQSFNMDESFSDISGDRNEQGLTERFEEQTNEKAAELTDE